ncbi:MAG: BMC domain-containing protein [Puniceicoccaceae bacterium]
MAKQAIGILETKGLIGLVQGTDAMLKAANVELAGPMKSIGNALVSAVVTGDVAAVNAAIEAGAEAAGRHGEVVSAHVIARPHEDVEMVVPALKVTPRRTAVK